MPNPANNNHTHAGSADAMFGSETGRPLRVSSAAEMPPWPPGLTLWALDGWECHTGRAHARTWQAALVHAERRCVSQICSRAAFVHRHGISTSGSCSLCRSRGDSLVGGGGVAIAGGGGPVLDSWELSTQGRGFESIFALAGAAAGPCFRLARECF